MQTRKAKVQDSYYSSQEVSVVVCYKSIGQITTNNNRQYCYSRPPIPPLRWLPPSLNCNPFSSLKRVFLKREKFCSLESWVNSIFTTILCFLPTCWKDRTFCLVASFSARREDHFQKKCVQNGPSLHIRFCKIGLRNTLFIFGRKNCRLLLLLLSFLQLCPILACFFFLIEALINLRKMQRRTKIFDVRFGNCSTLKYPDSADLLD